MRPARCCCLAQYAFDETSALLLSGGADDTIANMEGLTPYEGLTLADLEAFEGD